MDAQLAKLETAVVFRHHQSADDQDAGNTLRNHRRTGDARHIPMEADDKIHVQHDIDDARDRQINQRPFGVPQSPQHGTAEVVHQQKRHPHEIYPHIQRRLVNHIRGRRHHAQQGARQRETDSARKESA